MLCHSGRKSTENDVEGVHQCPFCMCFWHRSCSLSALRGVGKDAFVQRFVETSKELVQSIQKHKVPGPTLSPSEPNGQWWGELTKTVEHTTSAAEPSHPSSYPRESLVFI